MLKLQTPAVTGMCMAMLYSSCAARSLVLWIFFNFLAVIIYPSSVFVTCVPPPFYLLLIHLALEGKTSVCALVYERSVCAWESVFVQACVSVCLCV